MKNFNHIFKGINVSPLLTDLSRQGELWNQHTLRTTHPATPHKQVDDIWLRFNSLKEWNEAGGLEAPEEVREALVKRMVINEHESVNYPAWWLLPRARPIIFDLMRFVEGERLGRVLITRMKPGTRIEPHCDGGSHAAYYDRYHVTLQAHPGFLFRCGDEVLTTMTAGDVHWFDNSKEHELVNNSADDRLTLIIDIRTSRGPLLA